jgi:hypothetical protein
MYRWNGLSTPLAIVIAIIVTTAAQVDAVSVTMSPYSTPTIGQTRMFRGNVSGLGVGTVYSATITDTGTFGGSDGVFSGFDLDFLLLDADGDWATTGDRILPLQTPATSLAPGSIRNPFWSTYQPTASHPGSLFGLKGDGSIDFAVSTIAVRDASFSPALGVDTSSGWLTIGDNGVLSVDFPDTLVGSSLWLFVGEVGPLTTENLHATVQINGRPTVPVPGAILLASFGTVLLGGLVRRRVL